MSIPQRLRTRRIWNSRDFAEFLGVSQQVARARLKTYDAAMSGTLLIRSRGQNRRFTFHPAKLFRAFPVLCEEIEGLSVRVDDCEERLAELFERQRLIVSQVGHTSRELGKLRRGLAA